MKSWSLFSILAIAFLIGCNPLDRRERTLINITDKGFVYRQDTLFRNSELFTGDLYALHPNGDTAMLKSFDNGVEQGFSKIWYPDGRLAEERYFVSGRKEGIHRGWWQNGNRKFRYDFKDGEFNGTATEWYESGSIFKEFHYIEGYEQ